VSGAALVGWALLLGAAGSVGSAGQGVVGGGAGPGNGVWLVTSAALFGVHSAVHGTGTAIGNVAGADLVAKCASRARLGAVAGAQRTVTLGVMPISAAVFGLLGWWAGVGWAAAAWVVLLSVGVVAGARVREPREDELAAVEPA
jgi:hypothetical protein